MWRRRRKTASERVRRQRMDAAAKDGHVSMSVEEQIIERLKRMKLPEPPPGAKERALARYYEYLREQGRNPYHR